VTRRRIAAWLAGMAVCALAAAMIRAASIPVPARRLDPVVDPALWRGAWHVHTTLSDGLGSVEEVAAAAKRAGAQWVVLADHNELAPGGPRYVDGVLIVPSTEISSVPGHVVGLGLSHPLTRAERTGDALEAIRAHGGFPVAAHPVNRKRPYEPLDVPGLGGMEVLSLDDQFRDALANPAVLIPAALAYPGGPELAAARLLGERSGSLARWKELLRHRPLPAFCSIDAHGHPPYDGMMRTLAMYALAGAAPTGDASRDAPRLLEALRSGRSFCGIDFYGSAAGFRFFAEGEGPSASSGQGSGAALGESVALSSKPVLTVELAYRPLPSDGMISITCAGGPIVQGPVAVGRLALRGGTGACWAEVTAKSPFSAQALWVVSNPIYVR
jgi:hypothetical protein